MSIESMKLALEMVQNKMFAHAEMYLSEAIEQAQKQERKYTTTRNPWTGKATHKCNVCGRDDFRSEHAAAFHECQAIEQAQKPTTWISKEQLLQDWLPRLLDALKDVRHKENASAEETLYELYVEMKQETLAEKIDTMSHITPEDQLSSVIAELQATQKRLADTENILYRQNFEQAQKQEPAAWIHNFIEGGISIGKRPIDLNRHPDRWTALYKEPMPCPTCEALARTVMLDQTSHDTPPQRQWVGLTDDEVLKLIDNEIGFNSCCGWEKAYTRAVEAKLKEKNT